MRKILKKSWQIIKSKPIIWLFGFFSLPLIYNEINLIIQNFSKFLNYLGNFIVFKTLGQKFFTFAKVKNLLIHTSISNILLSSTSLVLVFILAIFFESWLISAIKNILKKENKSISEISTEEVSFSGLYFF